MGVHGLTTYIDRHSTELLVPYQLHDTRLVIDGSALCYYLDYKLQIPHKLGGEYRMFAESCEIFFNDLRRCKVEPFVILDGAKPQNDSKLETLKGRALRKIKSSAGDCKEIMPILTHTEFCCKLDKLSIECVMCVFEADKFAASLAKRWKCPILTNDSDFFIYNIPAGVIPLNENNKYEMSLTNANGYYISCEKFDQQLFRQLVLGTNSESQDLLALFAALLGNDFVEERYFADFTNNLPREVVEEGMKGKKLVIGKIVSWLHKVGNVDAALKQIEKHTRCDQRAATIETCKQSIKHYNTDLERNEEEVSADGYPIGIPFHVTTEAGNELPEWLKNELRGGHMSSDILKVLLNRRVFLLCQVEDLSERSSYDCSKSLRQIIYGVLLSLDVDPNGGGSDQVHIEKWTRNGSDLGDAENVKPTFKIDDLLVPSLSRIPDIDPAERRRFLTNALNMNVSPLDSDIANDFPEDVQFLIQLIRYWIMNATPPVTEQHVKAVLLTMLKLGAFETPGEAVAHTEVTGVAAGTESKKVVHAFAQFQTCFQAASDLSRILQLTEISVEPAKIFSGEILCSAFMSKPADNETVLYHRLLEEVRFKNFIVDTAMHLVTGAATLFDPAVTPTKSGVKAASGPSPRPTLKYRIGNELATSGLSTVAGHQPTVTTGPANESSASGQFIEVVSRRQAKEQRATRDAVVAAVYVDQQRKNERIANLVVSGLQPLPQINDKTIVSDLILAEIGIAPNIVDCRRLGKITTGKVQPLLVVLHNASQADEIMARVKDLRKSTHKHVRDNVFINRHLTDARARAEYEMRCQRREAAKCLGRHRTTVGQPAGGSTTSTSCNSVTVVDTASSSSVTGTGLSAAAAGFAPSSSN